MICFDTKLNEFMKRNIEIFQFSKMSHQSVISLLNWINSTENIVHKKTTFLHDQNLCVVKNRKNHDITWIEFFIERIFIYFIDFLSSFVNRRVKLISNANIWHWRRHCSTSKYFYLKIMRCILLRICASQRSLYFFC